MLATNNWSILWGNTVFQRRRLIFLEMCKCSRQLSYIFCEMIWFCRRGTFLQRWGNAVSERRSQCIVACVFHKASDLVIMASWLQVGAFSLRVLLLIGPSMAHDVESFRCSGCSSSPCLFISFSCLAQGAEQICASSAKVWTRDCSSFIAFACRFLLRIAAYFAQASGCCWNQVWSVSSFL